MRWPRPGQIRRLVCNLALGVLVWAVLCWAFLPYDSAAVLWIRFVAARLVSLFHAPVSAADWMSVEPRFPVNIDDDVAFISKTGYATHGRLLAQLDALNQVMHDGTRGNTIVIADFTAELQHNGHSVVVHDVVAPLTHSTALVGKEGYERIVKYKDITEAINSGRTQEAEAASKSFGWELDALKVSRPPPCLVKFLVGHF